MADPTLDQLIAELEAVDSEYADAVNDPEQSMSSTSVAWRKMVSVWTKYRHAILGYLKRLKELEAK